MAVKAAAANTEKGRAVADAVLASLQRYEIAPTPDNYALWYEYHAGQNPGLRRTIDILVFNNSSFDEKTLRDLKQTYLYAKEEESALRESALKLQNTLQQMVGSAARLAAPSDLRDEVERIRYLVEEVVRESRQLERSVRLLRYEPGESAATIEALENHLARALRDACLDGLTGLANRKAFDSAIHRLAGESMNSGQDLSLLLIDIDHFKQVNDGWGHCAGDAVLCHLAKVLQQSVRGGDHVARYGGEEFSVLLPRTDASSAFAVGENIREALAREPRPDFTPPMASLTVSIGVSCYEAGEPLSDWVRRTDTALYRAKREGRNRVQLA